MILRLLMGLLTWVCFPIYVIQGLYVRGKSMRLPPARGDKFGAIKVKAQNKKPLELLCIGDSGIAGVGCTSTLDTLSPKLAAELSKQTNRPILWQMAGFNSATAGELLNSVVPNLERKEYNHILISIGANDVKNWHSKRRFKREFGNLIYALHARFPKAELWWTPHVSYKHFPLLPFPLNYILEWRAKILRNSAKNLCIERDVNFIPRMRNISPDGFANDGFHPNAMANQTWAEHLTNHMLNPN